MNGFKAILCVGLAVLFCFSSAAAAEVDCEAPVETVSGLVRGFADDDTETCWWKGVPFAAPPKGDLRWRSPQPAESWEGVRKAEDFGDRCLQKGFAAWLINEVDIEMSEDCLYLNVWRPDKSGSFPVMLWIHGGGFTIGAASDYNPDRLAQAGDLVVVTVNYRLNVFGFFAQPELVDEDPNKSAGGQAILDMVAALEWVRDNVENFGGDPNNVTIFGESAGGMAVCTLLASPAAKGLFHRAIVESGGCSGGGDLEESYDFANTIAEQVGCGPDDLECLRRAPAEKLLDVSGGPMGLGGYRPHIDGHVLTDSPLNTIQSGVYNKVPLMIGFNRDEAAVVMKLIPSLYYALPPRYEKKLVKMGFTEAEAARISELYPLDEFDNRPVLAYGRMFGVDSMACGGYEGLMAAAEHQPETWFYRFDYDDHKYGKSLGSFHGLEILFIFDHLDGVYHLNLFNERNLAPAEDLARIVQSYWINFARTGDPNGLDSEGVEQLPEWAAFRPGAPAVQMLDDHTRSEPGTALAERCEFWRELREERGSIPSPMSRLR